MSRRPVASRFRLPTNRRLRESESTRQSRASSEPSVDDGCSIFAFKSLAKDLAPGQNDNNGKEDVFHTGNGGDAVLASHRDGAPKETGDGASVAPASIVRWFLIAAQRLPGLIRRGAVHHCASVAADLLHASYNSPTSKVSMSISLSGINSFQVGTSGQVTQYVVQSSGTVPLSGFNSVSNDGNDATKAAAGGDEGVYWYDIEQQASNSAGAARMLPPTITSPEMR